MKPRYTGREDLPELTSKAPMVAARKIDEVEICIVNDQVERYLLLETMKAARAGSHRLLMEVKYKNCFKQQGKRA